MKNISKETEEKLARSLTYETTDVLPFLPYLLQDFWELGSEPDEIADLINKYVNISGDTRVLDLACGKGAVSVKIAQKLRVKVRGIDLIPEFIEYAGKMAKEFCVNDLCEFLNDDINEAVKTEKDYDCVIYGAVGADVLGGPVATLNKLKAVVKPGGHIIIHEAFITEEGKREGVRYCKDVFITEQQWIALFKKAGLELAETSSGDGSGNLDSSSAMEAITMRANELTERYPDKKAIFDGYIRSQQNEYDDIDDSLVGATWILRKY
jgi:SAM-dependent methyltransferase